MNCGFCKAPIPDDSLFCPSCGRQLNSSSAAAPSGQPIFQPIDQPRPFSPPYGLPQAPPGPFDPRVSRLPRGGNGTDISRTGHILAMVFSALIFIISAAYSIMNESSLIGSLFSLDETYTTAVVIWIIEDAFELLCYTAFFVTCILLKELRAFICGIPLALTKLRVILSLALSLGSFDGLGMYFGNSGLGLVMTALEVVGIVIFIVVLSQDVRGHSSLVGLRVAAVVMLAAAACVELYRYIDSISEYFTADTHFFWIAYLLRMAFVAVILFTVGGRNKKNDHPARYFTTQ